MNFIEAITFYKNGEEIKRKGNALSLKPSYYLQKKSDLSTLGLDNSF